ncbi:dynamin family protein [Campylobacter sp. 9BO]|uniref:dynamin family protein n=1 Tax=Campylobacter sp. 9BO TaxID=3424759 RepID=UPI003D326953
MLKSFVDAYKREYFKLFSNDFYGQFKRFENALLEPKFHPSSELKSELKRLDAFIQDQVSIAIIGQFSSGKSTFINALLGAEILPTGVTPVTAKITHIRYGAQPILRVCYKNGSQTLNDISEIANFVDQHVFNADIDELCIYAPSEILKHVNFIDTPGLNSLSKDDTEVTKGVLNSVCAVIWLSLIDNAARASELDELRLLKDKSAICVLNQMDKLNKTEIKRVLSHAKTTYNNSFSAIIPLSAKQAISAILSNDQALLEHSNFNEVLKQIKINFQNDELKQNFVLKKCQELSALCASQHDEIASIHDKAAQILNKFDENLKANLQDIKGEFLPKVELAFKEIKEVAKEVADEILLSLKPKTMTRFQSQKTLLNSKKITPLKYEFLTLDSDEIFSKLIYNDVKFAKFLRSYKREITLLEAELKKKIDELYDKLLYEFMVYKSEFENIRKSANIHSDIEFATLRTQSGQVYELYLREFELAKIAKIQKLSMFFEKLNLKVVANYENAIKIAVYFFKEKIENARISHEKDPLHFALFIPSVNETYERVLTSLNLYEFENEMLSQSSFLNKALAELQGEYHDICKQKLKEIKELKLRHEKLKDEFLKIEFKFGANAPK